MHERRRLLSTAAWVGGWAALAAGLPARAFQVEEMSPGGAVSRAYAGRCGDPAEHAALVARLQALLAGDPSAAEVAASCPICGCRVVVTR